MTKLKDAPTPSSTMSITREDLLNMSDTDKATFKESGKKKNAASKKDSKVKRKISAGSLNRENRFLKEVVVHDQEGATIVFSEKVLIGSNQETGADIYNSNIFTIECPYRVNKDLQKAMKDLTKHALTLAGFGEASIKDTTVVGVKIAGEIENKNARAVFTIHKDLQRTTKPQVIKVPQTTLFDQVDYEKAGELVDLLEVVIDEVWMYIGGKHEWKEQLSIFND